MKTVPAVAPHTTPPDTVAIAVLLLLHAPPPIASASVVQVPTHMFGLPVIGAIGLTTTVVVLVRVPLVAMITVVPPLTVAGWKSPAVGSIVATEVALLLQVTVIGFVNTWV
jgi:hypothetical protein